LTFGKVTAEIKCAGFYDTVYNLKTKLTKRCSKTRPMSQSKYTMMT